VTLKGDKTSAVRQAEGSRPLAGFPLDKRRW
jgi:hypothetical protein